MNFYFFGIQLILKMQNQTKPLKIKLLSELKNPPTHESHHEKENSENMYTNENTSSKEIKISEIYEKIEKKKIKEAFLYYNQCFIFSFSLKISWFFL